MSAAQIGNTSAAGQAPSAPASPPVSPLAVSPPLSKHSQARYDIPTLDGAGKDYTHWKLRARLVFAARGLWGVIDGSDPEPDATTDTANHADWMARDCEAWIQIAMSVQGQCLNAILDAKNVKECWDKLANKLEGKGEGRVAYLMEGLFRGTLSESEPLEPQIETFLAAARNLDSLGFAMNEQVIAFAIIMALPESLHTLKMILCSLKGDDLSINNVTGQIYLDESCRVHASGSTAVTFFAKAAKKRGKADSKDKKKCTHCKRKGHNVSECRKLKQENEAKNSPPPMGQKALPASSAPKKSSARLAAADSDDSDEPVSILTALTAYVCDDDDIVRALRGELSSTKSNFTDLWILDSGASRTMCSRREWFSSFSPLSKPTSVVLGDNGNIPATGVGRIKVKLCTHTKECTFILQDVLYVPDLHGNLLSVGQLAKNGAQVNFLDNICTLRNRQGAILCKVKSHRNLFIMPAATVPKSARVALLHTFPSEGDELLLPEQAFTALTPSVAKAPIGIWHRRLAHLNMDSINHMLRKGLIKGMEISGGPPPPNPCEPCVKGKQPRADISKTTKDRASTVLGRIFSDVCKVSTLSYQGYGYFVTWIDDKSRNVRVSGLREKSEVTRHLKAFVARAELETGARVSVFRTDGGGEYTGADTQRYFEERGIKHEITMPDTPQQNGIAEHMNRTLLDKVRAMLVDAGLPETYWYDALEYAAFIHNLSPTRALENMTPAEA